MDCLQDRNPHFLRLCEENMYSYESSNYVRCSFFSEVVQQCRHNSYIWIIWRTLTGCGWWPYYFCLWISILWSTFYDLSRFSEPLYQRLLPAPGTWCMKSRELLLFLAVPTLTPVTPARTSSDPVFAQRVNSVCCFPLSEFTWPLCKSCFHRFLGSVLNDQTDGFHCVNISKCPCKFAGRSYVSGDKRSTNCQTWWGGRKKKISWRKFCFFSNLTCGFPASVCVRPEGGIALKTPAHPGVSWKGSLWQHLMASSTPSLVNVHMWHHR